jgi:hypothetical protein
VRGSSSTPGIPCILLANKADMVHLRQVSPEEGKNSTFKINNRFSKYSCYFGGEDGKSIPPSAGCHDVIDAFIAKADF